MIVDLYDSSALKKALDDPNLQPQAKLITDFLIKNNKNSEILLKYSYLIVERDYQIQILFNRSLPSSCRILERMKMQVYSR